MCGRYRAAGVPASLTASKEFMKWIEEDYIQTERRDIASIRRVLILTMALNFIAMAVKLAVGLATGALSVVADALDSLFDGLSNIVGLAGLYAAARPPDASHPYGHRKFETVAALSIAFLLFMTTWQLLQAAWARLGTPAEVQVNLWAVAAMLASMVIQFATSLYELRAGRRLKSELLVADALHTRASILVSLAVLGGLGLVRLGIHQADPILAAGVALVIGKIGLDVLRETLPVLLDQAAVDVHAIAEVVDDVGGIESFHRVRSRGALGNAAVDLHVRVAPEKTIQEANAIADEVRRRLLEQDGITDVTVHIEAQRQPAPDAADLFAALKHAAGELGLIVHEVWAHRLDQELFLEMHIGVDPELKLGEAHALVHRLEQAILKRQPQVKGVHIHIEPATTQVSQEDRAPEAVESQIRQEIERLVPAFPQLSSPHNIQVRRSPHAEPGYFVSLDCTIPAELSVTEAHHLASLFEQELARRLQQVADISIHLEPANEAPE
jgi:cation diffusion facilitator family transporter